MPLLGIVHNLINVELVACSTIRRHLSLPLSLIFRQILANLAKLFWPLDQRSSAALFSCGGIDLSTSRSAVRSAKPCASAIGVAFSLAAKARQVCFVVAGGGCRGPTEASSFGS
jgi:hypothetical protein